MVFCRLVRLFLELNVTEVNSEVGIFSCENYKPARLLTFVPLKRTNIYTTHELVLPKSSPRMHT